MPVVPYGVKSWKVWENWYKKSVHKPGVRYVNRFDVTFDEWKNLFEKKCFCGKTKDEFDQFQKRYCTPKHSSLWQDKTMSWSHFRYTIVQRDNWSCTECGKKVREKNGMYWTEWDYEVDHIQAISLGGMCFDISNVRTLCGACHREKTKNDLTILAYWKRECNYDIGKYMNDPQTTLDSILAPGEANALKIPKNQTTLDETNFFISR